PVTYIDLWLTRLVGFLPEFTECVVCGRNLNGDRAYFHALADGLMCADDKRLASLELSPESRLLAARMFRAPVDAFAQMSWPKSQGADLRKLLIQILQRQEGDRKSTRLNSSHDQISYAVFCLKKKQQK